ncbi:hypothetical protein IGI04_036063 [Brassica rapa subsp. trilocularis]|uniref:Uncharacterized protein n=1 Tax=Brassica rapa subsp. trilocularis TaxID=1813537 RepID=A0ABQ7LDL0_BRACM|nr:hypothetical protein IGI04_036063 [Brassica rapa subsp. trilocularis]
MESNDFSREMKTRSSYQVKKGRENEWIWSDWVKTVFGSCGIWSNQIKEEPLKEVVIFEDEAVQEITRKSGIEAASEERSKLVKGSEDKRVIRDWKQGKDELYQLVGRLKEVWLELTARPEVIQERREQDVIFNFLVNEMCELVQYICDVCEKNKKSIQWKGVTNCKKGRLRKLSKVWFMRRKAWRKDSESGYLSDKMSLKMIKEAAQLVVRGECSYSAYMGESVEDSVVLREQEKEGGADDCITRKEWRDQEQGRREPSNQAGEAGRATPLDHERGNGSESGEQEQNQQDSGHHNQEDGAQSSGDGQGESTGSGESVAQSTGSDESVAQSTGSEESGAHTTKRSMDKGGAVWIRSGHSWKGKATLQPVQACEASQQPASLDFTYFESHFEIPFVSALSLHL